MRHKKGLIVGKLVFSLVLISILALSVYFIGNGYYYGKITANANGVKITEVMANPGGSNKYDSQSEFFELTNYGPDNVEIKCSKGKDGWGWTTSHTTEDVHIFGDYSKCEDIELNVGESMIMTRNAQAFSENYPNANCKVVDYRSYDVTLNNDGDWIKIYSSREPLELEDYVSFNLNDKDDDTLSLHFLDFSISADEDTPRTSVTLSDPTPCEADYATQKDLDHENEEANKEEIEDEDNKEEIEDEDNKEEIEDENEEELLVPKLKKTKVKLFRSIAKGNKAEVKLSKNFGLTKIIFKPKKALENVKIKVEPVEKTELDFKGKVYKSLKIVKENIEDELIDNVDFVFAVEKEWFNENKDNGVKLYSINKEDQSWSEHETDVVDEDEDYVYLKTSGASGQDLTDLVIGSAEGSVLTKSGSDKEKPATGISEENAVEQQRKQDELMITETGYERKSNKLKIALVAVIISAIIASGLYFVVKSHKKLKRGRRKKRR